jgi:hypothetical protein
MERVMIHDINLLKGWCIGDLFSSLVYYRYTNPKSIVVVTHKSLHALTLFLFGDFVIECSDVFTANTIGIHRNFTQIPSVANSILNINYNRSLLSSIPEDELLPNNSVLLILNRSDNYVLPAHIINDIVSSCKSQNTFIRNVKDNEIYKSSYLKLEGVGEYTCSLMALIKSCMTRNIKIIMQRAGISEVFAYISNNPIFIIYPESPDWITNFTFKHLYNNDNMKPRCSITEYMLQNYEKNDFIGKLNDFVNL